MNKQIVSFRADGQILQKTDHKFTFAANIVSYIEAEFDLGEDWDGFDAVRAVWQSATDSISMVLDDSGKCEVPAEVLRYPSRVLVNLVGSKSVGGTLEDRLTTYPVLAFTIDKDARLTGNETPNVTPSLFEQFAGYVRADRDEAVEACVDAEAWAVGEREGEPVESDDITYHNNSKYYAEQSSGYFAQAEAKIDGFIPTVQSEVDAWMTAHPEYTTTVMDDSLTTPKYKDSSITTSKIANGNVTETKLSDDLMLKVIKDYVTPEMFGAKGDGVTDDAEAIQNALDSGHPVKLIASEYFVDDDIVLQNYNSIVGDLDVVGGNSLLFSSGHGIKSTGRYIAVKNISISAQTSNTGAAIYLTGSDSHMCQFDNIIITGFAHGIKYDVVAWDLCFSNIRVNSCAIGLESLSATAGMMCTTFTNVYFNHCTIDIITKAMKAAFVSCNFGIIASNAIQLLGDCYISFINCNFECDEKVTTTDCIIYAASVAYIFTNCVFKISGVASGKVFSCYGVKHLKFENCMRVLITGNELPEERWFDPSHPLQSTVGGIVFEGENYIPEPPYYLYFQNRGLCKPVMFWNTVDKTKLTEGQILYELKYHKLCVFNGTDVINLVDGSTVV